MENKDDEIVKNEEVAQDTTENAETNTETINQEKIEPGTDMIKVENGAEDEDNKIKSRTNHFYPGIGKLLTL